MTAPATISVLPALDVRRTVRELALHYVCCVYDVTLEEVTGPRKFRHLVLARTLFVCLASRHQPHVSTTVIGRWLGRDHSSVIHLRKVADNLLQQDEEFRQECARFEPFLALHRNRA